MSGLLSDPSAPDRHTLRASGLRRIHLGLVDAALAGGGMAGIAALAAAELGGAVAIVLPDSGVAVAAPQISDRRLAALDTYVGERLRGRPVEVPGELVAEVAVHSGDEPLGTVALLDVSPRPQAGEILELTALAALTALALEDAGLTQRRVCAVLLDDLSGPQPPSADEIVVRARRLGVDLSRGAAALCVKPASGHAERIMAMIAHEFPEALMAVRGDHVEALLSQPNDAAIRSVSRRLRTHAPTGVAPFASSPTDLPGALRFVALRVGRREDLEPDALLTGSWRMLLQLAIRDARELDAVIDSALGPILTGETVPTPDPLETLRAYLSEGANLNATATTVFAHRHTVAQRLERLHLATGHDPKTLQGQMHLALGLQALAVRAALGHPVQAPSTPYGS
jgi:hypothetical protein